jgi:hypothetical protein
MESKAMEKLYNESDLLAILTSENNTAEGLVKNYPVAVAKLLKDKPLRYRNFGAFWWLVKTELIALDLAVDDYIDAPVFAATTYNDTALNLLAAYAYSSDNFARNGLMQGNEHPALDDDEFAGIVIDEEMELLAT